MESFLEEACNREGKLAIWGKGSFGVGGWQRRDRAGEGRGGWIYLVTWNKYHIRQNYIEQSVQPGQQTLAHMAEDPTK